MACLSGKGHGKKAHSVLFGSRKKLNSQISYFYTTITKPSDQVKMEEGEVKEVRWRKGRLRRDR